MLARNCALTPKQLLAAFVALGLLSFGVSMAWALTGAWVVVPFMLVEWAALAIAFVVYCRHATDHERVTLDSNKVCVEVVRGSTRDRHEIPRDWLRCRLPEGRSALVRLGSARTELQVGRFVSQAGRKKFVEEFQAALAA